MALTVPPAFATATDLPDGLPADVAARATGLLEQASQLILDEDTRGVLDDLTTPTPTLVRITVAIAVRAALAGTTTPAGATQTGWNAGPFGAQTTWANPTGDLYLSKAERRQLGFSRQHAGGIDMWAGSDQYTVP